MIELVGGGKQRKGHFGIGGRGVPKVFERAHPVAAAPGTEPEPKRRAVILRRPVEKRPILPFGAIDIAGLAQFIADRQRDKRVLGIGLGCPPKGCKCIGSVAPFARAKGEPDKGAAVAGFAGDYLVVLRLRFIEPPEFSELVRCRQPGEAVLRVQRRGTAEEVQGAGSLASLAGAKSEPEQCPPAGRRVLQHLAIQRLGCIELPGVAEPVGVSQPFVGRRVRGSGRVDQNTRVRHHGIAQEWSAAVAALRCSFRTEI